MEYKFTWKYRNKSIIFLLWSPSMGPLQANISPERGGGTTKEGIFPGALILLILAQMYKTYPHIKESLKELKDEDVVIASKSGATDYKGMEDAVHEALKEMGRNYIDIFHLHSAKFQGQCFWKKKAEL